jgi:hypothetical protein
MTFKLRQIEFTADGRQIVREMDIAAPLVSIGRAAENDIHLPDLAVDPQHAIVRQIDGNRIGIEAVGTLGFAIDGAVTLSTTIDCRTGGELRFGNYRISASADADGAILLTIQPVDTSAEPSRQFDEKRSFLLASIMPGKRAMSWIFALLILGAFLAVPIASNLLRAPAAKTGTIGDSSWSPGELSLAHHTLKDRCEACHVRPFESVRNETCSSCHSTVHDHASPARMAGARGSSALGSRFLQYVAYSFGKPGPGACVDCHTEHKGAGRMEPARQQFCADCHGSLNARLTDTKLGNSTDFGLLHPQFKALVPASTDNPAMTRISLDAHPRENNGLAFPHKLHLDPLGGAARMAMNIGAEHGYGARLACKDCHHPSEDGVRFKPVNMERDCEACHSLAYDKVGTTFRTLRHGDVDQMIADLRAADHSQPVVSGRPRPGDYAAGRRYYLNFVAQPSSTDKVQLALSRQGVCGECHTPIMRDGKWSVTPVHQTARYMVNGWFDHNAHRQTKCSACHGAEKSSSAADLLLPGIAQCRTCHLGENSSAPAVPSSCAMCHAYHPSEFAPQRGIRRDAGGMAPRP